MAARTDLLHRRSPAWALTWTAAAAVLGALPLAWSAGAAADPAAASVVFTTPAGEGAVLTASSITLAGTVTAGAGTVESVQFTVQRSDGSGGPQQVTLTPDAPSASFQWTWSPPLFTNGYYTLDAVATTSSPGGASPTLTTAGVIFNVNVLPGVPTGLSVGVDPATGVATLTWQPNPEPDLTGYLVLRGGPGAGAGLAPIAEVRPATPTFTDSAAASTAPGTYGYAVVALRWNSTGSRPDASAPSSPVSVWLSPAAAASAAPPPPAGSPRHAGDRTTAPPGSAARGPAATRAGAAVPGLGPARPAGSAASTASTASAGSSGMPGSTGATGVPGSTGSAGTGSTISGSVPAGRSTGRGRSGTATGATAAASAVATGAGLGGRDPKLSSYELLDVALILSVVALLVAVGRELRGRGDDDDRALRPVDLLDEAGVGATMTIGDALALRGAALERDPGVVAESPARV